MKPLTILVINWVKPGCEDEYQRLLSPVLDAALASAQVRTQQAA